MEDENTVTGNWLNPATWALWLDSFLFPILSAGLIVGFIKVNEWVASVGVTYVGDEASAYYHAVIALLLLISAIVSVVGLVESVARTIINKREWMDILKLGLAIAVMWLGLQAEFMLLAAAFAVGFMLARSASHSNEKDFTPLVAFNAAAAGMLLNAGHAWLWVLPLVIALIYQIIEVIRLHDWYVVVAGALSTVILVIILSVTHSPLAWIIGLGILASIVVPSITAEVASRSGAGTSLLGSFKSLPGEEWLSKIYVSFDMMTAFGVTSMLGLFVALLVNGGLLS
jgi:hypothetical protein